MSNTADRSQLADRFFEQLPYPPYPVQEDALLAWFSCEEGVLVCAPTGTGKTMIAEAALFEALHTGAIAYYTTPLIALCEQKFRELQSAAVRWGFAPEDVGLVTGNRRENPDARVLVVVAEILLNRLLHREPCEFDRVSAVVMDEFHSFNDPERGIVWELSLGLLPPHVRLLLLSATVGNAPEFVQWMRLAHQRKLELVHGHERKVPLVFQWVPDMLLTEQLEWMSHGDEAQRLIPALIFCFNREQCWTTAETLKGKALLAPGQQGRIAAALEEYDFSIGAGAKLRQLLLRGVGVHHAGVLPRYRRIVEDLFQRKLLSCCVCTETLSAGINLPARSVVLPELAKGPPGKRRLLDPSSAHQMFGRAGRPQYDAQGYVFVLAHEDDVKIARWREKFDRIPADTKDPAMLKLKKELKRKMPTRREGETYWSQQQFERLRDAAPARLVSRGALPWRLLAYMLDASPEVDRIRRLVAKRLAPSSAIEEGQRELDRMLLTLHRAGYVRLEPPPPVEAETAEVPPPPEKAPKLADLLAGPVTAADIEALFSGGKNAGGATAAAANAPVPERPRYRPDAAHPTENLSKLLMFRGIHPLYAVYLIDHLGMADRAERLQAMESVLELPPSLGRAVRVPRQRELPPGPLAVGRLDVLLLQLGLATEDELVERDDDEPRPRRSFDEPPPRVLTLADKLRRLFDYDFPGVSDLRTFPVWVAGELLEFGGDFEKYVSSKSLQKQEGVIFRHLLRLILLVREFTQLVPPEVEPDQWRGELNEIASMLTESCRRVDPASTDRALEETEGDDPAADDSPA